MSGDAVTRRHEARDTAWRRALGASIVTVLLATFLLTFSDRVPWRLQLLLWRLDVPGWMTPNTVMKIGHFVAWAVISALAASFARRPRTATIAAVAVATASLVTEVLQSRLTDSRLTNPTDAAVNLAGVFVGWAAVRATSIILRQRPATPGQERY